MTATTTAHATRPPEFDARLMAYRPGMRTLAAKFRKNKQARNDLVTDTIAYCLEHWQNFREDGGFYNWIYWQMRGLVKNAATYADTRKGLKIIGGGIHYDHATTQPTQAHTVDLAATISALEGRAGDILLRRAMGETLQEIGVSYGISRERVRQIVEKERERVRKKMGVL